MELHLADKIIIVAYICLVIVTGWLLSRKAGKNMESYFLGGKNIPWYILGVSHGASGFDITGTMWFALMLFTYGGKGIWILWIWPMFAMVFRMMYLGTWIRRSNVLTGAEWMRTRFGGTGGQLAHISMVIYAILGVIGFLAYAFKGIGKFSSVFFPWKLTVEIGSFTIPSDDMYAVIILLLTSAYLIVGGMYSVVITDLLQFALLSVSAIWIAGIAISQTTGQGIVNAVPDGWINCLFGKHHDIDWSGFIPALNNQFTKDGWNPFSWFIGLMLFKGILVSIAGPTPGYGIQHVLATRSPKEAALESWWISVIAFFPRFLMISAIVVLGLVFFSGDLNLMGEAVDFEQILPMVINKFVPVGVTGLVLAGLLAAFMSTFDSTVNAGSAYVVNDIYKKYIDKNAPTKRYVYISYCSSILIVLVGIFFGFKQETIGSATKWIVSALFGGFTAPNILRWVWWRFNGYGYFAGMISGAVAAVLVPYTITKLGYEVNSLHQFPIILAFSTISSIVVCLLTPTEDYNILSSFYKSVRPWGSWTPVYERVKSEHPNIEPNRDFKKDMTNCAVGIIWQTSLVAVPVYLVFRQWNYFWIWIGILVVTSVFLKFNWYDKLGDGDMYMTDYTDDEQVKVSEANPQQA